MDGYNMEPDLTIGSMTIRSILSNKDILSHPLKATCTDKDKDYNEVYTDATAAFLGPNIWDKSLSEFKMDYLDLDALLNGSDERQRKPDCSEQNEKVPSHHHHHHPHPHHHDHVPEHESTNMLTAIQSRHAMPHSPPPVDPSCPSLINKSDRQMYPVDCKFSPSDLALATPPGQDHYDPTSTCFPDEELKPQPIIKKSRKNFVPDNLKDDKYWARRHKNNIAAKRSREARRLKENQIVLRASYLEKENNSLKEDVMRLKAENDMLKNQLKEYQS